MEISKQFISRETTDNASDFSYNMSMDKIRICGNPIYNGKVNYGADIEIPVPSDSSTSCSFEQWRRLGLDVFKIT